MPSGLTGSATITSKYPSIKCETSESFNLFIDLSNASLKLSTSSEFSESATNK